MKKLLVLVAFVVSGCGSATLNEFPNDVPDTAANSLVETDAAEQSGGSSWFSLFQGGPKEDETTVDGPPLPFGSVEKVCRYRTRDLGTKVDTQGGFALYDSNPSLLGPRTHFLTGFRDRCARKLTAGMAFLGDPLVHETRRYKSRSPFSDVDTAYETVKNRICRVDTGEACGDRIDQLSKDTTFVSLHRAFGTPSASGTLLLHRGRITASSF